jgi:hypothetical protein
MSNACSFTVDYFDKLFKRRRLKCDGEDDAFATEKSWKAFALRPVYLVSTAGTTGIVQQLARVNVIFQLDELIG